MSLELAPGSVIVGPPPRSDRYTVVARHGEGGFGVTYLATDRLGARVVLKQLRVDRLKDWKSLELFEREAATLQSLAHPRIPAYRDFFAFDGEQARPPSAIERAEKPTCLLLVQSFVEGETLAQASERGRRWSSDEAKRLLVSLLRILEHLHAESPPVVHRDINPRNVILSPTGDPYLVDFGAVQDRIRLAEVGSTSVGTAGYMPIEQAMGSARPQSDLFALGITMLQVVSGLAPTEMPMDDQTAKVRVDQLAPSLADDVREALSSMVEPIVGHRAKSAAEVLARLEGPPRRELAAPRGVPPSGPRGGALVWGLAATMVLAAVGGLAALTLVSRAPRSPAPASTPPRAVEAAKTREPPVAANPRPTQRPAEPRIELPLTFKAKVVTADGQVAPGAACTIEILAQIGDKKPQSMRAKVTCGTVVIYDAADPLEGTSHSSWGLREEADPKGGHRYAAKLTDQGNRSGKRAQILLDTGVGQATVWRDDLPAYRVKLSVAKLSDVREGGPLLGE